jgi:predicted ATP-grasp superfamily ATP-dependent carboligase
LISGQFAEVALAGAVLKPWPTFADVPSAGTVIDAGRPILTLYAEGASLDDVERRLHERAAETEQMIYSREIEEK